MTGGTLIDLELIMAGDMLIVTDSWGNRCTGAVSIAGVDGAITIDVFSTDLVICQRGRISHKLAVVGGLKIVGHQPQLFGSTQAER